jgi:hypothetical protein
MSRTLISFSGVGGKFTPRGVVVVVDRFTGLGEKKDEGSMCCSNCGEPNLCRDKAINQVMRLFEQMTCWMLTGEPNRIRFKLATES